MKAVNFWKTLFCSVLAITAFTACSDDDDDGNSGIPEITVNNGTSVTVARNYEAGETSPVVSVVSKGDWTLKFDNANDATWCTPSVMSGKTGTTTLTFNVSQTSADRQASITLTAMGSFEGIPLPKTATVIVKQTAGGVVPTNALYSENCGTDGSLAADKPKVSAYTGWQRGGSLNQSGVTYAGDASVRDVKGSYLPVDDEKNDVSGTPIVYIGSATQTFDIENINIATNTNFTFTFTALDQASYSNGPVFTDVTSSTVKVSVSVDGGQNYVPVDMTAKKVGTGSWYICTAAFKLPASVSTDKLSIRLGSYPFTGTSVAGHQGLRVDDFKLYEGGNGPELGDVPAIEYKKATISQITEAGNYQIDDAVVIANYQRGFLMQDATGIMQVYQYDKDSAPTPTVPSVGKKYTVKGVASSYGGLWQIGPTNLILENESTGTVPTPTLVTLDAAGMDALFAAPAIKYVKYTGELTIDGDYYNVNVNGATTVGSISYPNPGVVNANLNGKGVDVEGWFIGATGGKYFTTLGVKVTENAAVVSGEFTTQPTTFAATSPVAQTLNFTANAAAGTVTFELAGTNADMFTYSDATTSSVKVNAKGNNTSSAVYTATLKLKAANGTVLDEVELTQAQPGVTNYVPVKVAPADWSGTYVVGYPASATECYILKDKFSGATATRSTFTYEKLGSPAYDGTNIAYDATYNTITITKIAGTDFYSIKYGDMYMGWTTSTGNSCEFSATAPSASTPDYQWTPTMVDNLIVLTCTSFEAGKKPRLFQFNANSGQERFAIYASTQKSVMLYKLQ